MILGLDISTSITGATIIDDSGNIIYNEAWDTRKYKNFFQKAEEIRKHLASLPVVPSRIYVEQSLQSFRSGFSSAKTLSTLSRFNGVVSWICYKLFGIEPEYIAATSARKECGIKISRGTKAKEVVLKYVIDNVPEVMVEYTKHGNPKPASFDRADSYVVAQAGYNLCQRQKS